MQYEKVNKVGKIGFTVFSNYESDTLYCRKFGKCRKAQKKIKGAPSSITQR